MVRIVYSSKNFPPHLGKSFQGQNICDCTWAELLWAAITVGKAERTHLMRLGRYSSFEILYRAAIIYANLMEDYGHNLYRSQAYDTLDPSEKSAVSYFLGLTNAKLLAEKFLNVPWLMHIDVYRDQLTPEFWRGKAKPDLMGMNRQREWVILEAKGRTNGLNAATIAKAKSQTRNLRRIAGDFPVLRVALISYFQSSMLKIYWQDPDDFEENAPDIIDFSQKRMLSKYYKPFIQLFHEQRLDTDFEMVGNRKYVTTRIEDADMTIGIDAFILQAEIDGDFVGAIERLEAEADIESELDFKVGSDGIFIRPGNSWSDEKMILQPQER